MPPKRSLIHDRQEPAQGPRLVTALPPRAREKGEITDEMLMYSRVKKRPTTLAKDAFTMPRIPPGVVPKERTLAMDAQVQNYLTWAAQDSMFNSYADGMVFLGFSYLATLAQRPEYRVVTETIAAEMTREWIEVKSKSGDEGQAEKIADLQNLIDEKFKLRYVFRKAAESDGFFGRGHIYVDTGDTDDRDELVTPLGTGKDEISRMKIGPKGQDQEGAAKKQVQAFRPVEAVWAYPTHYESSDPLKSDWYDPTEWYVMSKPIHKSRFMTVIGRPVPDILKPAYAFGGLSMSQMLKPYVDNWLNTRQSVSDLIRAFSVFVLKTQMDATTGVGGDNLFKRVQLFNEFKNNQGSMVVDKETEDFGNVSVPLGGLDALQAQSQEHMASISRIPIVKLLGIQPAGLNASSEGELITFYDWIHAFQEILFRDPLTSCIDFVQLSEWGEVDEDITFDFKSLRQLDEGQKAGIEQQKAQTHEAYLEMGVVDAPEIREAVASDPDSPYAGLDLANRPMPEPPGMPGMEGMGMPGEMGPGGPASPPGSPGPALPGQADGFDTEGLDAEVAAVEPTEVHVYLDRVDKPQSKAGKPPSIGDGYDALYAADSALVYRDKIYRTQDKEYNDDGSLRQ